MVSAYRMPKETVGFEAVRELGLAMPGVEEGTAYGSPALTVHGKMFACLAINRSAEPDSLVAQVDFVNRDLLIAMAWRYVSDQRKPTRRRRKRA